MGALRHDSIPAEKRKKFFVGILVIALIGTHTDDACCYTTHITHLVFIEADSTSVTVCQQ